MQKAHVMVYNDSKYELLVKNIAFCQNNEIEYYEYEVYTYDSIGTPILIEDPESQDVSLEHYV